MELHIDRVSKRYKGNVLAVDQVSLCLQPGVIGLLGPNGAGKSSLMRILTTVMKPTDGQVLWNGVDVTKNPNELRKVLGYLPQDFGVYPHLNAVEFLQYMAAIKGISSRQAKKRINDLLQLVHLTESSRRPLGGYSSGMRQRVGIAQALLNDPALLIVDEPTVGLDPEERVRFRNLLSDLSGDRIVLFSTHIVSDIESTANQIAVMQKGKILSHTDPETMLEEIQGKVWEMIIPSDKMLEAKKKWLISGTIRRTEGMQIRVVSHETPTMDAIKVSPTLEDAYLFKISTRTMRVAS
ncbi:ABC-type multidrug transport system, ATPase component [Seinonella peptonophila]|uniref:ABC-type multidrug transport system, ATPase component n=1 Tax=Seinonella peptonophila TaxID=112248 RepID=A0A1M4VGK6_9BACL|nr:ABC transporter ATP-binding protein [Seinonella peptonophila]SHE68101.1 ABC-type multidrug transport system, ATPase component [Seinonella peptonophila]